MPAAAAAPMQGTYIPQYTAVPASAITVEVRTKSSCLLTLLYHIHTGAYIYIGFTGLTLLEYRLEYSLILCLSDKLDARPEELL